MSLSPIEWSPQNINEDTIVSTAKSLSSNNYRSLLDYLNDSYHNDEGIIPDDVYDTLLEIYENKFGPYNRVGALPTGEKVPLPYYLGSLRKVKTNDEIEKWRKIYKGPYLIEDKVDGLTLLIVYQKIGNKRTIRIYTRGGGHTGSDVSHLADYINLPRVDYDIAVRGEIVMNKEAFERVRGEYKNARNLVSGIVNSKKQFQPSLAKEMTFYAYRIMNSADTPENQILFLMNAGFQVPSPVNSPSISYEILSSYHKDRIENAPYEMDGLVVYNNTTESYPEDDDPKHVIAFKMPTETKITTVTDVIWEASKNKLLKPVVHYETVNLSGADLQRASGYNARFIVNNNIGPGAVIVITRSGDVIPKILSVVTPSPSGPSLPDPNIHGEYTWNKNQVEFVLTEDNDEVLVNRLVHFISTIGVKNIGPERIRNLVAAGIDSIELMIRVSPEDLQHIPGFGSGLSNHLVDNLKTLLTNISPAVLMAASGYFPNIGVKRFENIFAAYPNFLDYYDNDPKCIAAMIMDIRGFKDLALEIAYRVYDFVVWLDSIPEIIVEDHNVLTSISQNLAGFTIVFSGFRDSELESQIKERGGKVTTSVSKNTTLLIMKDIGDTKGKAQKAISLNIPLVTRDDFVSTYLS